MIGEMIDCKQHGSKAQTGTGSKKSHLCECDVTVGCVCCVSFLPSFLPFDLILRGVFFFLFSPCLGARADGPNASINMVGPPIHITWRSTKLLYLPHWQPAALGAPAGRFGLPDRPISTHDKRSLKWIHGTTNRFCGG
jgi:hypothetical protein